MRKDCPVFLLCVCACADLSIFCECPSEIRAFIMIRMNYWSIFRWHSPMGHGPSRAEPPFCCGCFLPIPVPVAVPVLDPLPVRSLGHCSVTGFRFWPMICCLCSNLAHRTLQRDSDCDSDSASGTRCSVNLLVTVKKVFKLLLTVGNRSHRLHKLY